MMNILYPIKFFFPFQKGGYSQVVLWLARSLCKHNFKVTIITSTKDLNNQYKADSWTIIDGMKVRYCTGSYFFNFRIIFNSIKNLKKCDILHLTSIFYIPSFVLALFGLLLNKKIIWSIHGELANNALAGNKTKLLYLKTIRFLFNKIIFHSTSSKETLEIKNILGSEKKIIEIPNYMEIREPLNLNKEKSIVFVGRIDPIKALDKLINAVALSKIFVRDNYRLYIIGDDKDSSTLWYVKELKELISKLNLEDQVIFLGNVFGDHKYEYYSKAKCSLLVSETENFGNVVIESLSQGTPVIASLGTPWAVLKKEKLGDHVSNEPKNISIALDKLLSLPQEDYNIMSKKCISWSFENFSIEHHINDWIECYNNL